MHKRTIWLYVSMLLSLIAFSALITMPQTSWSNEQFSDVIISEVAWGGTAASEADEWIELHNRGDSPISLENWYLAGSYTDIALSGSIQAYGFYLLERTDDSTISDIPADLIYVSPLRNSGDSLFLSNDAGVIVDTANADGGQWPAGSPAPEYLSMERVDALSQDEDENWLDNDTITRNGVDALGNPINGTPAEPNSHWIDFPGEADLAVAKHGPSTAFSGSAIIYAIEIRNIGDLDTTFVTLTDTLPFGFSFSGDDSGLMVNQPVPGTLVWHLESLPVETQMTFHITATIDEDILGTATNTILAHTEITETTTFNNIAFADTTVIAPDSPLVLIDAAYYDSQETNEPDEAVRLVNIGGGSASLGDWILTDGVSSVRFPEDSVLAPGDFLWLAKSAAAFDRQFGFLPQFEAVDSLVEVPDLLGPWPGFNNHGDEVILLDGFGQSVDVLVYEGGNSSQPGWIGPASMPYVVPGIFAEEGQILYRIRDPQTNLPPLDTNSALDWAQNTSDAVNGRRVQYPGWDSDRFFKTHQVTESTSLVIGIAPDNAYQLITNEVANAQDSILISSYTFRHLAIAQELVIALSRGVSVTVLLEGGPAGGVDDQEKYICRQLEEAGGQCWFMINDENQDIYDRYRNYHAKYMIIDNQTVIISSENLSPDSLPNDDKSDGTWGRRGLVIKLSSPSVVQQMLSIWAVDFDPNHHADLFRWSANHPIYGDPPPGMVPITITGGTTYTIRYPSPIAWVDTFHIEVIQSPDNSLLDMDSLLGLINDTDSGDAILAQELYERPHWGVSGGNAQSDPNPRLELMLDAARRGVKVRLLLDDYFDDPTSQMSNWNTCLYVNKAALAEGLNLKCALANPTGLGIHNKMILVEKDGLGYVHVGSLNGSELSSKGNREIAIQIQSNPAFDLLQQMFVDDWPHSAHLPLVYNEFKGPSDHVLISELLYDPYGPDDAEYVEIANPTGYPINLSGFRLGDALNRDDYEDVRYFPVTTIIGPGKTIVVATTATGFHSLFGFYPDFEILDSDPLVTDMIDDPEWGDPSTFLQLGNLGDEIILRTPSYDIVDAIGYGSGSIPGVISCGLVSGPNISLERYPYWKDTDNCQQDFRAWPFPNPGDLP